MSCYCDKRDRLNALRAYYAEQKRLKETEVELDNKTGAKLLVQTYRDQLERIDRALSEVPECGEDCSTKSAEAENAATEAEMERRRQQVDINKCNVERLCAAVNAMQKQLTETTEKVNQIIADYDPLKH